MASLLPHAALLPLLILILAVLILIVGRFLALRGCRGESEARTHLPLPLPLPEPAGAGVVVEEELEEGGRERGRRRRRRKARRKGEGEGDEALQQPPRFPLASVAGSLRRRITARYDDLARATHARCLTIDQVHEFINCLVDARNELLHKSETVQRSCRVKKALLSNPCSRRANSYERLCEQVHKLEAEHKRLKKDADIYNYIQEQLQMSHSYKLLTELSAMMERADREEALSAEATEMTFEELLALEKSDAAFWQRHRKLTSISSK